jgi:CRP-like cAMP-binding protein
MEGDIKKIMLFEGFNDSELALVQKIAKQSVLNQGQVAFHEGDPGDSLIILNLGTIQLTKGTSSGDKEIIATLGSGDYLGEMSLFDKKRRSLTGKALERCEITIIPFRELMPLLDKNPNLAAKFYKNVSTGISRRLRNVSENIAFLRNYLKSKD